MNEPRTLSRFAELVDGTEMTPDLITGRDLRTLIELLAGQVRKRTHVFFHGDENHVRGGYESIFREPGVQPLAAALGELDLLYDLISASLNATYALRVAGNLIDE